jgi:hypothetical protein
MNPRIKQVTPLSNYKFKLIFTNREWGIYDCSNLLNFGIFQEVQNIHYFNQAVWMIPKGMEVDINK